MINTAKQKVLEKTKICDKVMAGGFYALIFSLPIAPAFVESFFGLIIFSYLIKRILVFRFKYTQLDRQGSSQLYGIFIQSFRPVPSFLNRPIGIFTLIAFISIFVSYAPVLSLKGFFFKLLQGTYLYFLFIECMNSRKRINIFVTVYLAALSLVVVNGIVQYVAGEGFVKHYLKVEGRISSSMKHPNELGVYILILIPFLLYLNKCISFFRNKYEEISFIKDIKYLSGRNFQVLMGILLLGTIFCFGVTYSRGAWGALIFILFFLFLKNKKRLVVMLIVLLTGISIFTFSMIKERKVNTQGTEGVFTVSGRDAYNASAWEVIKRHPILGTGLNTYSVTIVNYDVPWKAYPHNCYLHLAAELGALGLGAFLWIVYKLYNVSFKQLFLITDLWMVNISFTFLAGLLGFLLHSSVDTFFYSTQLGNLLWIIIGLIVASQHVGLKKASFEFV